MIALSKVCEMLSIKSLLEKDKYLIPMYQRNYAWEEPQLKQLVQDVWDCCDSPNVDRNYYLGTLVVHNRPDGSFETVDGQQRLTTLNIMLCAIKNEILPDDNDIDGWYKGVNISYEYRKSASLTLDALYKHDDEDNLVDEGISNMYSVVKRTVESIVPKNSFEEFLDFFLEKVKITRVILPEDTDLNHYFEIMNSRGEQLEKHEILKAKLMKYSAGNKRKNWLIGQIWDACSDMDRYVQSNLTENLRHAIFGTDLNDCSWCGMDDLLKRTSSIPMDAQSDLFTIQDVLKGRKEIPVRKSPDESERFNSIISFPTFLLQVLRVIRKEDIPLDDKRLISSFDSCKFDETAVDKFISEMIRLRYLFDKFVIKRDYKENQNGEWSILYQKKQEKSYSYNLTIEDSDENCRLIMIESMFHVSLPSQNYKHWLCAVLKYLYENNSGNGLAAYLEGLAKGYIFGRFLANHDPNESFYFDLIFGRNGKFSGPKPSSLVLPSFDQHVDFFIFNYLDYCYWHQHRSEYKDFEFTSRSSVEHFYPRHPNGEYPKMDAKPLNDIGNLCLISRSKNSKLSNYQPLAKTEHYYKAGIDSIKQSVMMEIAKNGNEWGVRQIQKHHKDVESLLLDSFDFMGK